MAGGLYRTTTAGPGRTLLDAFEAIETLPRATRLLRHSARDLTSARVVLTPEEGEGFWELIRIRHELYLIISDFTYREPRFELVPGDDLVQFNFNLSGDMNYSAGQPEPLRFNRPSLHIWRQPRDVDMQEWTAANAHHRMVAISVHPELLRAQWLDAAAPVPLRLVAFLSQSGKSADYCHLPLTARMIEIASSLIDNAYDGLLYLLNAEAIARQLLCAAIDTLKTSPEAPMPSVGDRELKALSQAREILSRKFASPPTLSRVARQVGLSERTLTAGFKAVYGETLFDFTLHCRMQHAMTLLRDRHWSVDRTSEAVGYSQPTSFATAFRRHFGLRPIDVKRLKTSR